MIHFLYLILLIIWIFNGMEMYLDTGSSLDHLRFSQING